jgi:hypothetical protein
MPKPQFILTEKDGRMYFVFRNEFEASDYMALFSKLGMYMCCFDRYMNAFCWDDSSWES